MSSEPTHKEFEVTESGRGVRLDRWLAAQCRDMSRARLQELIEAGLASVNGAPAKPALKLRAGDRVILEARPRPPLRAEPESIPLEIVCEDDDLLIVNKPAGMTVHAGAGNWHGTLVNALLGRGQSLSSGGTEPDALRPGIVHRIDKETSGLILIAKNDQAHAKLAEAFRTRVVQKTYIALAEGQFDQSDGKIALPVGRDPVHRTRMKAFAPATANRRAPATPIRSALTEWHRLAGLGPATLLAVQLHTGRTHQIRVHLSAIKHPLVGDTLYGAAPSLRSGRRLLPPLGRQFLHAAKLAFPHPRTGQWLEFRAPLAPDLREYLLLLDPDEAALEAAREYL